MDLGLYLPHPPTIVVSMELQVLAILCDGPLAMGYVLQAAMMWL